VVGLPVLATYCIRATNTSFGRTDTISSQDRACQAQIQGKRAVLLVWDNASWHDSQIVKGWLQAHTQQVKHTGQGVRLLVCPLPVKSPWLNPIEPKWLHSTRTVLEPDRLLSAADLVDRVCAVFACPHEPHLIQPKKETSTSKKAA